MDLPWSHEKTYVTSYRKNGRTYAGPRLQARSWKEAAQFALKWNKWLNHNLTVDGELVCDVDAETGEETVY